MLKKEKSMFLVLLFCIMVCMGCSRRTEVSKNEVFKYSDEEISSNQININFAWKDNQLNNYDIFYPAFSMDSDWGGESIPTFPCSPVNGDLGIVVKTAGNQWTLGDLYRPNMDRIVMPAFEPISEEVSTIYKNAEWKFVPLLDDYNFWINDIILTPGYDKLSAEKSIELFEVIDKVSGAKFTISLDYLDAHLYKDPNYYEFKP